MSLQDKYGRAVVRTQTGNDASYEVLGSDTEFTLTLPADVPLDLVMEKIGAMAPVVAPSPSTPVVPDEVAMWQLRLALQVRGKLDAANTLAAGAGDVVQAAWDGAATVARASPVINALAPALGLSQNDVDAIFIEAAAFVA